MFGPRRREPVVAIVVVTVHQRRGAHCWFGLTDQRHLGGPKASQERRQVVEEKVHVRKGIEFNMLNGAGL